MYFLIFHLFVFLSVVLPMLVNKRLSKVVLREMLLQRWAVLKWQRRLVDGWDN